MKLSEQIRAIALEYGSGELGNCALDKTNKGVEAINRIIKLSEAHELTWTKTLPTVVGWYWARIGKSVGVERVYEGQWHLSCNGMPLTGMVGFEWAGPINPPQEGGAS